MQLDARRDRLIRPRLGAYWEGFALNAMIDRRRARPEQGYFWGTHATAELDLFLIRGERRLGFEVKHNDALRRTPSMRILMEDL